MLYLIAYADHVGAGARHVHAKVRGANAARVQNASLHIHDGVAAVDAGATDLQVAARHFDVEAGNFGAGEDGVGFA